MNSLNSIDENAQVPTPGRDTDAALRALFHRLNNQLSVILAHAELLESKATNDVERSRASQVVSSVLDAMGTSRQIRMHGTSELAR